MVLPHPHAPCTMCCFCTWHHGAPNPCCPLDRMFHLHAVLWACMETPDNTRCVWRPIWGHMKAETYALIWSYICVCSKSGRLLLAHTQDGDQVCLVLEIYSISLQPLLPVILLRLLLSDILLLPRQQNTHWLGSSAWRVCVCVRMGSHFSVLDQAAVHVPACVARAGGGTAGVCERGAPETTQRGTNLLENEAHCVPPSTTAVPALLQQPSARSLIGPASTSPLSPTDGAAAPHQSVWPVNWVKGKEKVTTADRRRPGENNWSYSNTVAPPFIQLIVICILPKATCSLTVMHLLRTYSRESYVIWLTDSQMLLTGLLTDKRL